MFYLPGRRLPSGLLVPTFPRRTPKELARMLRPYDAFFMANNGKHAALTGFVGEATHGSLHTAYSTTGTNEVTGGSPAYARKALTWASPSGGAVALAATFPTWDVPGSTTVAWIGFWDAITTGNFSGMMPAGGGPLLNAMVEVAADITNNDIYSKAHGLVADNRVVFWGTLPTGISVGTIYFVISTGLTTDSFRVSTSSGGSAVDLTGTQPFGFFAQKCVPETFAGQGTYALSSGSVDLAAVA